MVRAGDISRREFFAGVAAAGGALHGCRGRDAEPATLTALFNAEPEHLDPRYPGDALGSTTSRLVFAGLLDADPVTFAPRTGLAESFGPTGPTRIHVRLRDGLRFHDGSPLTSRDVVATYESVLDPARGSTSRGTYARVFRGVRAVGPLDVEFELTGEDGTWPSLLQQPILRAQDVVGREILATPGNEHRFVGSGAMRVRSLARGAWELERVERVAGRPERIRLLAMRDPNTLALRLLHGSADVAEVKPELFPVFDGRGGFTVASARSVGFTYLGVRNDHPVLARQSVRVAIAHAIDRHALMRGKFGRFALESTGPLPPSHWAYTPAVTRHGFDPDRSRELLDRVLPRPAHRVARASVVLRATSVRFTMTVARALAEMLAQVGIDVEVRQSDLPTLLADLRAGRFDLTVMTMPDLSDPWGLAWLFASTSRPTPANPRAGGNRWRYSNVELDVALEAGRRAMGVAQRRPHYQRAQAMLSADLPVIPLWHADVVFAGGRRVSNLHPRGDSQLDFLLDVHLRERV